MKKLSTKLLVIVFCVVMALSLTACGGGDEKDDNGSGEEYTVDAVATTLTIAGVDHDTVVYEAADLEKMGTVETTYSGRNKKVENARIFQTFTGVELKTLLKEAGYESDGAVIKIICSDGYTKEYAVDDLYNLYAFADNESDNKTQVSPMIAIVEPADDAEFPAPFELVCGQADYDTYTNEAQDFNAQNWISFIQYIEVSYK